VMWYPSVSPFDVLVLMYDMPTIEVQVYLISIGSVSLGQNIRNISERRRK